MIKIYIDEKIKNPSKVLSSLMTLGGAVVDFNYHVTQMSKDEFHKYTSTNSNYEKVTIKDFSNLFNRNCKFVKEILHKEEKSKQSMDDVNSLERAKNVLLRLGLFDNAENLETIADKIQDSLEETIYILSCNVFNGYSLKYASVVVVGKTFFKLDRCDDNGNTSYSYGMRGDYIEYMKPTEEERQASRKHFGIHSGDGTKSIARKMNGQARCSEYVKPEVLKGFVRVKCTETKKPKEARVDTYDPDCKAVTKNRDPDIGC